MAVPSSALRSEYTKTGQIQAQVPLLQRDAMPCVDGISRGSTDMSRGASERDSKEKMNHFKLSCKEFI